MRAGVAAGAAGLALAGLVAGCAPEAGPVGAARDYAAVCADCHGPGGRGNGRLAVGMRPAPSDLTRLAADAGGAFPTARVMARLRGYATGEPVAVSAGGDAVAGDAAGLDRLQGPMMAQGPMAAPVAMAAPGPGAAPVAMAVPGPGSAIGPVAPVAASGAPMPVLAALREGPVVMYDDGASGRLATPARLVALTDYLRTIQGGLRE